MALGKVCKGVCDDHVLEMMAGGAGEGDVVAALSTVTMNATDGHSCQWY